MQPTLLWQRFRQRPPALHRRQLRTMETQEHLCPRAKATARAMMDGRTRAKATARVMMYGRTRAVAKRMARARRIAVPTTVVLVMIPGVTAKVVVLSGPAIETAGVTAIPAETEMEEEAVIGAETVIEAESVIEAENGAGVVETEEVARVVIGEVDHGGGAAHAADGGATPDDDPESARTGVVRHQIADAPQDIGADIVAGRRQGGIEAPHGDREAPQANRHSD